MKFYCNSQVGVLAVLLCAACGFGQTIRHKTVACQTAGARVAIEEYASRTSTPEAAALILLYGSGGARSPALPYTEEARRFAGLGLRVFLPHYLDVTRGSASEPALHYQVWARAVCDVIQCIELQTGIPPGRMVMVGYSLGGSVALAAAAQEPRVAGIVVWSGSLPDSYRDVRTLPPLLILHGGQDSTISAWNARRLAALCTERQFRCELNIYPDEGHAFSTAGIAQANGKIRAFLHSVLRHR